MARISRGEPIHGWVNFDKPLGMTSTQAVAYIKRAFNAQKAGHGGTLDPLATGVLPIALGEATKTMNYSLEADKAYTFTITFGVQRTTDDAEGEVSATSSQRPTQAELLAVLPQFTGDIEQLPPQFSALKIGGQAAYTLARKGETVAIQTRRVTIHRLEVLDFTGETATLYAETTKGTYVRALARDIGLALGCYGYVSQLTRNRAGVFHLDAAVSQSTLDNCMQNGDNPQVYLKGVATVLADIPAYVASPSEAKSLRVGKQLLRGHLDPGLKQVLTQRGELVALVMVDTVGKFEILRNFAPQDM